MTKERKERNTIMRYTRRLDLICQLPLCQLCQLPNHLPKCLLLTTSTIKKVNYTIKDIACYITIVFIIIQNPTTHNILWIPMYMHRHFNYLSGSLLHPSYYILCFVFSRVWDMIVIFSDILDIFRCGLS